MALAVPIAVVLALAAAPAHAAPGAKLKVTKVKAPPQTAEPGERFRARGRVVNKGELESGRARVRLELRGGGEKFRIGKKKIGKVDPGEKVRFKRRVRVPRSIESELVGEYEEGRSFKLRACVKKGGNSGKRRCKGAKRRIFIVPPIPPTPPAPPGPEFVRGARTLGDPLLPQIGNGGYDARNYRIEIDYDPAANEFEAATTTVSARATQNLRQFSLDFQDLDVTEVTVNGRAARFAQVEATPDLSTDPAVTQPMKLVVTPATSARPLAGQTFTVEVDYAGTPPVFTDPDTSIEGWIPACYPLDPPQTCDGAFVVGEPMGSQSWFPSNNYPTDKATFDTILTVPEDKTALGVGEIVSRQLNGDGTHTWHWREDDPTATYLTTGTVGDFDYTVEAMIETSTSRALPIYNAIDSTATPDQRMQIDAALDRAPGMLNFLSARFGPYPFDSTGAVVDRAAGVGYALEVQTKPHFAGGFTSGDPSVGTSTLLHEIAHQWFGNSITLASWREIWFNEGWATWLEWYWGFLENGGDSPADIFDDLYANTPDEEWEIAPATLDGDPANLFHTFPVYDRSAMTLQGYREIVGGQRFRDFARELTQGHAYGNIGIDEFIRTAEDFSGFSGAKLELLRDYFDQWLVGTEKPTILPEDFA